MMKIFITVGTTPFDELIKHCDLNLDLNKYSVTAQISQFGNYLCKNINSFEFSQKIDEYYQNADIVISHAGAGSVYKLLEINKKSIFVPNHTMKDGHQEDICRFVENNNYAAIYRINKEEMMDFNKFLAMVIEAKFSVYIKDQHVDLIDELYKML